MGWWGWLLGVPASERFEEIRWEWGRPAALGGPWSWALIVGLLLLYVGAYYYRSPQRLWQRATLGGLRWTVCAMLLISLLDPQLRGVILRPRPRLIYWLLDNSASMTMVDQLPSNERQALDEALGWQEPRPASRLEYLQQWWRGAGARLRGGLEASDAYTRGQAFLLGGANQLPVMSFTEQETSAAWTGTADRTPLGDALEHLLRRVPQGVPDAVIVLSDFAHNAGSPPLDILEKAVDAERRPQIFAVGIGPTSAVDLSATLIPPNRFKRAERAQVQVALSQHGLDGQTAQLRLRFGPPSSDELPVVAERTVRLTQAEEFLELEFTPGEAGLHELVLEVNPLAGESATANNVSRQYVTVIDDFLRVGFIAYEPTWEWRFVKEVFHRDPLVGVRGFRTYLQSSSPRVREMNPLFLPGLVRPRSEFFATDVVVLGDMPADSLTTRFGELIQEFVRDFGGGLVILSGPRFGPQLLADTPLKDLLPVELGLEARRLDTQPFAPLLTPMGARTDFMSLGFTTETSRAERGATAGSQSAAIWNNMQGMNWYYPVQGIHPLATVLAVHPEHRCADGQRQPLIVTRSYGRGQVVYLANDEIWRLRRGYGELYYRQFWSQLLNRLALGHPLGEAKRFRISADSTEAAPGETITLTLEAYNENYEPWGTGPGPGIGSSERTAEGAGAEPAGTAPRGDAARSVSPDIPFDLEVRPLVAGAEPQTGAVESRRWVKLAAGRFESQVVAAEPGIYRAEVKDASGKVVATFDWHVVDDSPELRDPTRNGVLQQKLAEMSQGRAYELTDVDQILNDLKAQPKWERVALQRSLWQTPLWFLLFVILLSTEWALRFRWRLR